MPLPLVINPDDLQSALATDALRLVDVRKEESWLAARIAGAERLDPALLNRKDPPVAGLLPDTAAMHELLDSLGIQPGDHIVAYDDGAAGSNAAARMIWVLHAYGYMACSWLNGGLNAWQSAGYALDTAAPTARSVAPKNTLDVQLLGDNVLSADALLARLNDPDIAILDVRSLGEYAGTDVRANQGGHVPGARHQEWTAVLDKHNQLRPDNELREELQALDITPDKTVVVYCQSHQRSALTYVMLKHLGFNDVRALDGAWSSWGNRDDTPKDVVRTG